MASLTPTAQRVAANVGIIAFFVAIANRKTRVVLCQGGGAARKLGKIVDQSVARIQRPPGR